jgi:glycolate oxidase iron-sulfur subunit
MQTHFTLAQLADPDMAATNDILRTCVHCGFCTATCPTYTLLGDELDSPRGRIYLMKQMFEADAPATEEVVTHIDRCLSCLSCMTTCPSGVHYQHLVDHGRKHIEETYTRPFMDRMLRMVLAWSIPYPLRFRTMLVGALLARPFRGLFRGRMRAMLDLAPTDLGPPSPVDKPQVFPAEGVRKGRVALLNGCAQTVIAPADQRSHHSLAHPSGCGSRGGRGDGLLRITGAPHGPDRRFPCTGCRQYRCLAGRRRIAIAWTPLSSIPAGAGPR